VVAGAGCHADAGDARLASGATHVGTCGDGVGGGSTPPAVAPLVRAVHARGLCDGDGARAIVRGSHGGRPVVWVRKGWKQDKDSLLVWRDSGVGVGSLVSEPRCPLVRGHPQKMLVPLSSIFRRVKTVLSFRKSRVFSRTRFQFSKQRSKGECIPKKLRSRKRAITRQDCTLADGPLWRWFFPASTAARICPRTVPVHHRSAVHLSKAPHTARLPVNTSARLSLSMGARPLWPRQGWPATVAADATSATRQSRSCRRGVLRCRQSEWGGRGGRWPVVRLPSWQPRVCGGGGPDPLAA